MFAEGPTGVKTNQRGRKRRSSGDKGGKEGTRELGMPDEQGESCQSGRVAINVLSSGFSIVSKQFYKGPFGVNHSSMREELNGSTPPID